MIELKIGSTVSVEGHEFVVVFYRREVNRDGSSLVLQCHDPMLATKALMDADQRKEALTKALAMMRREEAG